MVWCPEEDYYVINELEVTLTYMPYSFYLNYGVNRQAIVTPAFKKGDSSQVGN